MNPKQFYQTLIDNFPFDLTNQQNIFFQLITQFLYNFDDDEIFVLKGYAGTGKTTVITHLVQFINQIHHKAILIAPTGRAAKVMSQYANLQAFTIHKKIYFPKKMANAGMGFTLQKNKFKDTIFIVDEASMISDYLSDGAGLQNSSLLEDLIYFVYSGKNCKLVLVGDSAQLPPINSDESPALQPLFLESTFLKDVVHLQLDEVMRQSEKSGILFNATLLRKVLNSNGYNNFTFQLKKFKDIIRLQDGYEIQDAIENAYSNYSIEDTAFIVRSNKRANQYNQQIRAKILGKDAEISVGDYLMIVKNNYFWIDEKTEAGFIANGDIIEILSIQKFTDLYGFRFVEVTIRMIDYPNMENFDTILMLDTLTSESPSLTYSQSNQLYQEVLKDYEEERYQYKKTEKVKKNPYFNALQVKFSYAITCHKAQGGQWCTVFIEQPYLPDGIDVGYLRWLYTALTRASNKVYLIGFKDDFFE